MRSGLRNLAPELRAKIGEMHAGWLGGADRLRWPIVEAAKIDAGRRGRINEVWGHLTNGKVDLLTIVLDYAIQIWPGAPSPQGFLWARWRSWPQLNGFWGGAVLLARGERPKRMDASHWLSHELIRTATASRSGGKSLDDEELSHGPSHELIRTATTSRLEEKNLSDEELREIYESASQLPSEDVKEQLSHHHMVYLADLFEGWALDESVSRENLAYFLGFAESLRNLADEVGPDWRPPETNALSVLGHLVRWGLGE